MGRGRKKSLTPALEDYLKVIYEITNTEPVARVKDIAARLNVSLPSVTNAMKRLKDLELVNYEKYGLIILSETGKERARTLARIHELLDVFFVELVGVPEKLSDQLSCRIEHYFDPQASQRTEEFIRLMMDVKHNRANSCQHLVDFLQQKGG
ncbi:MAG TPA: metal-dependent transcriptional regulator [Thermotogota bacterium]|nr:metal-dependent transcriptional regulator [Thermotogota bacterium]HRW93184.1 metal-dependent transcriptional regulator [Thermotogota bacterium]